MESVFLEQVFFQRREFRGVPGRGGKLRGKLARHFLELAAIRVHIQLGLVELRDEQRDVKQIDLVLRREESPHQFILDRLAPELRRELPQAGGFRFQPPGALGQNRLAGLRVGAERAEGLRLGLAGELPD